jgi:hypothetical protein
LPDLGKYGSSSEGSSNNNTESTNDFKLVLKRIPGDNVVDTTTTNTALS